MIMKATQVQLRRENEVSDDTGESGSAKNGGELILGIQRCELSERLTHKGIIYVTKRKAVSVDQNVSRSRVKSHEESHLLDENRWESEKVNRDYLWVHQAQGGIRACS